MERKSCIEAYLRQTDALGYPKLLQREALEAYQTQKDTHKERMRLFLRAMNPKEQTLSPEEKKRLCELGGQLFSRYIEATKENIPLTMEEVLLINTGILSLERLFLSGDITFLEHDPHLFSALAHIASMLARIQKQIDPNNHRITSVDREKINLSLDNTEFKHFVSCYAVLKEETDSKHPAYQLSRRLPIDIERSRQLIQQRRGNYLLKDACIAEHIRRCGTGNIATDLLWQSSRRKLHKNHKGEMLFTYDFHQEDGKLSSPRLAGKFHLYKSAQESKKRNPHVLFGVLPVLYMWGVYQDFQHEKLTL